MGGVSQSERSDTCRSEVETASEGQGSSVQDGSQRDARDGESLSSIDGREHAEQPDQGSSRGGSPNRTRVSHRGRDDHAWTQGSSSLAVGGGYRPRASPWKIMGAMRDARDEREGQGDHAHQRPSERSVDLKGSGPDEEDTSAGMHSTLTPACTPVNASAPTCTPSHVPARTPAPARDVEKKKLKYLLRFRVIYQSLTT